MLVPGISLPLIILAFVRQAWGQEESPSATPTADTPTSSQAPPTATDRRRPTTCHAHPPDQGPPLPLLDRQFSITVEATIKQKSYTMTMELHYDYVQNRAVLFITKDGVKSRLLYNFPLFESYFIQDDNCSTMTLRNRHDFQWINYTEVDGVGHVSDVHDLLNFGTKYNETYVQTNSTVRGMPVDQWTSCVDRDGATFRLDYFFTQTNYSAPSGHRPIPVRAILTSIPKNPEQGTKDQHMEHVYDFVTYRPGACSEPQLFRIPRGAVCDCADVKKPHPTLPDHFSMGVEVIQPAKNLVSYSKQYFDYAANLTRTDITPSRKTRTPFGEMYGYRPLKIIHDYSTGLQYVIDVEAENCSMKAIPNNSVDARTLDTDPSHVHMRHGADMFSLNTQALKYQGKRVVRDITCDVWAVVRAHWLKGVNTTMETCWTPRSHIGGLSDKGDPTHMVLVQIWIRSVNKTENYSIDYISNMFDYQDGKPDLQLFDIADCFSGDSKQLDIIFRVPGTLRSVVRHQPRHLQVAVRDAVSKAAGISPIRVNSLFFEQTSPDFVDVWMTIYDAPSIRGDVDKPVPQVSLQTAYKNLESAINSEKGLIVQLVSDAGSKSLRVEKDSLKTDKDIDDPRLPFAYCDKNRCGSRSGHSSGSMAALGIMMLILGVVLGLVGAFFLWKRGTGIPYQVQD